MSTTDWLIQILLGGILGACGQLIRSITTYKKVSEQARSAHAAFSGVFDGLLFFNSLVIGFVAVAHRKANREV